MAITQVVFIFISSKSFLENFSYLVEAGGWRLEADAQTCTLYMQCGCKWSNNCNFAFGCKIYGKFPTYFNATLTQKVFIKLIIERDGKTKKCASN